MGENIVTMYPPGGVLSDPLDSMDRFINVANELATNPALLNKGDREPAKALHEICRMILTANENLSHWLHRLLDLDFNQARAREEFKLAANEFNNLKNGPELQQLKYRCGDIMPIYDAAIRPSLKGLFVSSQKRRNAEAMFKEMSNSDSSMISFIEYDVIFPLDEFVGEAKRHIDAHDIGAAEGSRLKYKAQFGELSSRLERFNGELAGLVVHFSNVAKTPDFY